ncbi:MAG TPA: COR domain-containing protein [Polyangium sp.]|nr:COR domain-containing protein [Polyangium sp.]
MASEGFEEARRRIRIAEEQGHESLDLSNLKLAAVPLDLTRLARLKTLDLSGNRLTDFPTQVLGLTTLRGLALQNNKIVQLPRTINALRSLRTLILSRNRIRALPMELAELTELETLAISHNGTGDMACVLRLTRLRTLLCAGLARREALPPLAVLKRLESLDVASCGIEEIPPWLFELTNLVGLRLDDNPIRQLDERITRLSCLQTLSLQGVPLETLPVELATLPKLEKLLVDGAPLPHLPPELVTQGNDALLTYLREQYRAGARQWVSKLLVVGEGGVGKTSLLRALRNETFNAEESTTHGIDVRPLLMPHGSEPGITMQLNAWDFGGQQIYHATHQFFLTNRSLFVLVWNARLGYEQGRLYYWLDTIRARAPESPVLLVATQVDERSADLPLKELRQKYPQIALQITVSNKTRVGIEELRQKIREVAGQLPLMGERWPRAWLDAANAVRALGGNHITPKKLSQTMAQKGVAGESAAILARWLHELGDILYFQDNPELDDIVLLDPHWVTASISRVLACEGVIERRGIFTREQMREVWSDIEPYLRDHLLRLMEQFDLSYRTLDNRDVSIVVERLSHDEPQSLAPCFGERLGEPRIAMRFVLDGTMPAGIPTWFIARTHRFTTDTHYRQGALFADGPDQRHLGLVQAFPHGGVVTLEVRGPAPQNFFTLLKDGLELTLARFPGMRITRLVPCPGHDGAPCTHEFKYEQLQKRLERDPPLVTIECPEAAADVDVRRMLFGLSPSTRDDVFHELDALHARDERKHEDHRVHVLALTELVQREFLRSFQAAQRLAETHCPAVFVLRPEGATDWAELFLRQPAELHLVCQAPGAFHLTTDAGRYRTTLRPVRLGALTHHLKRLVSVLKYVSPAEALFRTDIQRMEELVHRIRTDLAPDTPGQLSFAEGAGAMSLEQLEVASLRVLRGLLDTLDPQHAWGGLQKVLTPEGHYLWLCERHAAVYRS